MNYSFSKCCYIYYFTHHVEYRSLAWYFFPDQTVRLSENVRDYFGRNKWENKTAVTSVICQQASKLYTAECGQASDRIVTGALPNGTITDQRSNHLLAHGTLFACVLQCTRAFQIYRLQLPTGRLAYNTQYAYIARVMAMFDKQTDWHYHRLLLIFLDVAFVAQPVQTAHFVRVR